VPCPTSSLNLSSSPIFEKYHREFYIFFMYISVLLTPLHFQNNAVDIKIGNERVKVETIKGKRKIAPGDVKE
jgi:hypothetical protein